LPTIRIASEQLSLVNSDRMQAGLPPLDWSNCLASIAAQNAQPLAAQGYLTATSGPEQDVGCALASVKTGENLGYWSSTNDAQLNAIFMNDPARRANVLGPYRHLGAAWATAPTGVAYLVIEFG
jgi:uncharacterized protein YkwD